MYLMLEISKNIWGFFCCFVSTRVKVKALNWEQSSDVNFGLGCFRVHSEG